MDRKISRRDFLKATLVFGGTGAILASCGPLSNLTSPQPTEVPKLGYTQREVFQGIGSDGKAYDYVVWNVDIGSIKKFPQMQGQLDKLKDIDHVSILSQKHEDGRYYPVSTQASAHSKGVVDRFNSLVDTNAKSPLYKSDSQFRGFVLATVLDPEKSVADKMTIIGQYINLSGDTIDEVKTSLEALTKNYNLGKLPANSSIDFLFDNYMASLHSDSVDQDFINSAESIGLQHAIFVPKSDSLEKTRTELKSNFMDISQSALVKPEIYKVEYQVLTPGKKVSDPPSIQTFEKLEVRYNNRTDRIYGEYGIPSALRTFYAQNENVFNDLDVTQTPPDLITSIASRVDKKSSVTVTKTSKLDDGLIQYAWVPNGSSKYKGDIKSAVFLNFKAAGTNYIDPLSSEVMVINDNSVDIDSRVDKGWLSWISNIDNTVRQLLKLGVSQTYVSGGLTPPAIAFARLMSGINSDTGFNSSMLPKDETLLRKLAGMELLKQQLNNWGTPIWQGGMGEGPVVSVVDFTESDWIGRNIMNLDPSLNRNIKPHVMSPGDIFPIAAIEKDVIISYRGQTASNGTTPLTGGLITNIIDQVIAINNPDTFSQILKIGSAIAPWAAVAIALLIDPEVLVTDVIPFLQNVFSSLGTLITAAAA